MSVTLLHGDCLQLMPTLPANSVDSIVCDPPYMLNFMGKAFDRVKDNPAASVEVWAEALRVAKPGSFLLAFGGDRTHHRLMVAIEDAGWEIKTCLYWIFGSGFPKSLAIDKAIDKANGRKFEDRYALGRHIRECREEKHLTQNEVNAWFGYRDGCQHWERQDPSGARVPTLADWRILQERLNLSDEWLPLIERIEAEREVVGHSDNGIAGGSKQLAGVDGAWGFNGNFDITAPATDAARQWAGWGTSLKPAVEIIVMARKPLSEPTIAQNVLAWGTGGINVDGCRVEANGERPHIERRNDKALDGDVYGSGINGSRSLGTFTQGRWPANLLLSEEAAALLDEQSGERVSRWGGAKRTSVPGDIYGNGNGLPAHTGDYAADRGGASRYFLRVAPDDDEPLRMFYCPKASAKDRNEGLEGMPERLTGHKGNLVCLVCGRQKFSGSPCECVEPLYENKPLLPRANHHPTVKPTQLMRWLVRLVTPPGGVVLDNFCGSGSTLKAAILEGFDCIGIDNDAEYLAIAEARCAHAAHEVTKAQMQPMLLAAGD